MTGKYNLGVFGARSEVTMSDVERRLLVVLAAVGVVAVGLSAAATMSRGDSAQPASKIKRMKPTKNAVASAVSAPKAGAPVVVSSGRSQSSEEVERYWTEERMESARPMEKTRQGPSHEVSPTTASAPAPSGAKVPGRVPAKIAPAEKLSAKSAQSADTTGAVSSPAVLTPNYWTDDAMDSAQPLDNTRPGDPGSQSDPGSGGTTMPGSPPP